jgi:hypothetical protein
MASRYVRSRARLLFAAGLLVGLGTQVCAENFIPLAGALPPTVVKAAKPYMVTGYLEIPAGQQTVIEKGVVMLFRNFTGITVLGTIQVKGSADEPVIFTSENDSAYNPDASIEPAPFDWDGVTVKSGELDNGFEYCTVQYSLFGIKSETNRISFTSCVFRENGKSDVIVGEQKLSVISPFTFKDTSMPAAPAEKTAVAAPQRQEPQPEETVDPADLSFDLEEIPQGAGKTVPAPVTPEPKKKGSAAKVVFRLLSIAAVGAGGALGVKEHLGFIEADEEFRNIDDFDETDKMTYTSEDWEAAKNHVNNHLYKALGFYGCALVGAVVFTVTFAF